MSHMQAEKMISTNRQNHIYLMLLLHISPPQNPLFIGIDINQIPVNIEGLVEQVVYLTIAWSALSPLHPHYHVKAATRGGVSSKGSSVSSHALASNVAGRSRMRTGGRGDKTPDKGSSVPKFGEWDESNPSSAYGFTGIFNKVREEKK
ncbi:unnamed protein product, partial [Musa hybrid cultivar]